MADTHDAQEFQVRLECIDTLVREAERFADPAAQALVRELVAAILELHAVGLERLVGRLAVTDGGRGVLEACADDEVVNALLLLHDLHPLAVEARVQRALDRVRPLLQSRGGDVELLEATEGHVRVRLTADGHGCGSSAAALKQTVEQALLDAAPEAAIDVEGAGEPANLVQLGLLSRDDVVHAPGRRPAPV